MKCEKRPNKKRIKQLENSLNKKSLQQVFKQNKRKPTQRKKAKSIKTEMNDFLSEMTKLDD